MEVTIRDVAAKAQVSFQLVSAVLGNKSYARPPPEPGKKLSVQPANWGISRISAPGFFRAVPVNCWAS